jgi:hypothetical protein
VEQVGHLAEAHVGAKAQVEQVALLG